MESFKLRNFVREHPNQNFPTFKTLDMAESSGVRLGLVKGLGLVAADSDQLVKQIDAKSALVPNISAEDESFDLQSFLSGLNIQFENDIYINWYKYDVIDVMNVGDLSKYFEYIWYPGPDDIDLFDDKFSWVLSINHSGQIKLLRS